jgi:hypothetical protein
MHRNLNEIARLSDQNFKHHQYIGGRCIAAPIILALVHIEGK